MGCLAVVAWPYPLNIAQSAPPAVSTVGLIAIIMAVLVVLLMLALLILPVPVLLVVPTFEIGLVLVAAGAAANGCRFVLANDSD
jgi:hypothetical protein